MTVPPDSTPKPAPGTHACPGGCGQRISFERLSCPADWFRLPQVLRTDINATYRRRRQDQMAHVRAVRAAVDWYRDNPIKPNEETEIG